MRGNNFLLSILFWCCLKSLGQERIQVFISDPWCAVKLAQVDRALRYLRCGNPDLFPCSFCVIYPGLFVLFSRLSKDQWHISEDFSLLCAIGSLSSLWLSWIKTWSSVTGFNTPWYGPMYLVTVSVKDLHLWLNLISVHGSILKYHLHDNFFLGHVCINWKGDGCNINCYRNIFFTY